MHEIWLARFAITAGVVTAIVLLADWHLARRTERRSWETDPDRLRKVAGLKIQWRDRRIRDLEKQLKEGVKRERELRERVDGFLVLQTQAYAVLGGAGGTRPETETAVEEGYPGQGVAVLAAAPVLVPSNGNGKGR